MLRITFYLNIFVLWKLVSVTNAARILAIVTTMSRSHFSFNHAILKSLHTAGHEITMISPYPSEDRMVNLTHIQTDNPVLYRMDINELLNHSTGKLLSFVASKNFRCYRVMELPEIQKVLRSSEKSYDLLLIEYYNDFECYLPLAQKQGIPVIATVALRSWRWADQTIGVPNNLASIPGERASTVNVGMSFMERIENLWTALTIDYFYTRTLRKEIDNFYRKYYPDKLVWKKDVSLVFYNNHVTLMSRPSVPNAIDVGGIHLKEANPLPKHLQTFIDDAPHGVILFTLGSHPRVSSMPEDQRYAFLAAFASIPQRVIWKYEDAIENLPENVMVSEWLPQRDLLEHKNVIAFISHCGVNGVYEAIATGTPIITMPLFTDQRTNAALLRYRGVAVDLDWKKITKETILHALDTIVNDTGYYERMQKLSLAFKDRPLTPQQSVVYWTEYVLRHNGTSHLRALGTDIPLYKYFMLDIIAVALFLLSFSVFAMYFVVKNFIIFFKGQEKYRVPDAKKVN